MKRSLALGLLLTLAAPAARAQLADESTALNLELKRDGPAPKGPFEVQSFKGRYAYEVACFLKLLPLDATIRRCVDSQRLASGEFHDRLDFDLEPSGKLKRFAVRRQEQLQACLMPHVLSLRFPAFAGTTPFTLQVLVASPGVRLGRHTEAKPIAVFPVSSEEEKRAYLMAASWVFSPWSQAISHCAELADQQLGFGYEMRLEVGLTSAGRPARARLELKGKLATRAAASLAACVTPFVRAMAVPPHGGRELVTYRYGTRTARWQAP
jgi:hypothetical protein